ncbi:MULTISPECIES: BadF/BadG/BcrA/BcrD ATPase family protein [Asticcacaulis]|uniref:BadF/BadG/BcrA/BcrD ATPase family protein n=1 Tax=Asticcacaulis TaxID=76890 RepID=UPI001AE192B4|nr:MULTISPECIES: BadF/BadG/BcrA/BcrD ATPase family protein [Asticcacaulis]MBP2157901.1 glucosamine kinase [Asticcacaulis solisilvae]MDR6798946.1 glucosamine kinase [Asticcacaulis sp. BE141]
MVPLRPSPYIIGVDGGGTRCRVRLQSADGQVLAEGESGPANIRLGLDLAWSHIAEAIDAALQAAGLTRDILPAAAAGLGLAGVLTEKDAYETRAHSLTFGVLPFGAVTIASDAHIACLGAFAGGDGAIQIAGTGSCSYLIADGQGRQIGGWGFVLDERGSSAALGRDAVKAALNTLDGLIPESPLTQALIALFGSGAAAVDWSESATPAQYGGLSPMVFDHARQDDPVALSLLGTLAGDIDRYIRHLVSLGAPGVCLMGGLGQHIRPWLAADVVACLREPRRDPLSGAILLATGRDIPQRQSA